MSPGSDKAWLDCQINVNLGFKQKASWDGFKF